MPITLAPAVRASPFPAVCTSTNASSPREWLKEHQGRSFPASQQADDEQQGVGSQRRGFVNLNRLQEKSLRRMGRWITGRIRRINSGSL